ncbi:hypothetical protein WISP_06063 [Willisornis vidua]|uniref:Uncharacterized protein n=1 Tax=Willisornis vidua TaxID=1566151 RepID=A0ABQ9DXD1_9PASS|nr:hypothetical protein WISP_06063 [Willisornis vidua]
METFESADVEKNYHFTGIRGHSGSRLRVHIHITAHLGPIMKDKDVDYKESELEVNSEKIQHENTSILIVEVFYRLSPLYYIWAYRDKTEVFNAFFDSVFNMDDGPRGSQCPELEDHDFENDQLPVNSKIVHLLLWLDPHKSMGPEKEDSGNYRPVSFTSITAKVIEKIILGIIEKHLKDKEVIGHSQPSCMKGKSYLSNLIFFYDKDKFNTCILFLVKHAQEIGSGDYSNLAIIPRNNVFAEAKLMSDVDEGIEWTLSQFTDHTMLDGNDDLLEGRKPLPGDMDRLNVWAKSSCVKFNKPQFRVLHFGHNKPLPC